MLSTAHSLTTATQLAINNSGVVNAGLAKGFIMPKAANGYSAGTAVGDSDVYTKDYFKFRASGGALTPKMILKGQAPWRRLAEPRPERGSGQK